MPKIICPECKKSFNIDESDIGKECECPCGNVFTASISMPISITPPETEIKGGKFVVKKASKPPKSASSSVAFGFRLIAYFILAGGIIAMFAGVEAGPVVVLSGLASIIASLPFFAISVVIEALLQIQENTWRIADYCHSMGNNQKK